MKHLSFLRAGSGARFPATSIPKPPEKNKGIYAGGKKGYNRPRRPVAAYIGKRKMSMEERIKTTGGVFREGMRDGIPIGLGYFAVAFALGIQAQKAGLGPVQSFFASLLCNASAGEKAGLDVIVAGAPLWMMALTTLVVNARYLLMSTALSQRMDPKGRLLHRFGVSMYITDELFAISIAREGYLDPFYLYGAALVASPCWALGTAVGCVAGDLMPPWAVSALSVALYGMFLAAIIPSAKKDRVVAVLVALAFAVSFAASRLPGISRLEPSWRIILLSVTLCAAAALLFPRTGEDGQGGDEP